MANEQMCCGHTSSVDRISDLPDGILHHILSYLPTKVVAQTSVLSKRWQYLWDSYPIFDFCQHYFYIPGHKIDVERVTDVVDRKLKSFCKYEFEIQKFRLSLSLIKPKYASLVEKWMVLVKERHVKELELALHTARPGSYNLPREIFVAKSLTALQICVDEGHDILLPSSIKLHSLVRLCLTGLHIDEMIFDDHKFPCIEFIQFSSCIIQGGLKVSCHQLKKLLLIHCEQFCKIEISAPNLSSMSYFGGVMPTSLLLSLNLPFKLKKFKLSSGSHCRLNTSWYIKLKESLLQMQNGTETLVLFIDSIKKNKFDSIGASKSCRSPPYSLKCLVLNLYLPRIFDFEALLDGFLSIFHPEILSVIFKVAGAKCCLEILFKTIEGREDQSCCSSSKIKCCRHSFKVKQIIVKKFKGIKEKIPLTWDAFSKAMCEETYKVDFYLTW